MSVSVNNLLENVPLFFGLEVEELSAMSRLALVKNYGKVAISMCHDFVTSVECSAHWSSIQVKKHSNQFGLAIKQLR